MGVFDSFSRDQNKYFDVSSNIYNNDKSLLSIFVNEYYNKYGVPMEFYITTYDQTYDRIFGEDNNRFFIRKFMVMGYYNTPKEDKIWTKFGIMGTDDLTIWISKRHFDTASKDTISGDGYECPKVGDIIKSIHNSYFYEITEVAEDVGQFLQSNQFIWELSARQMKIEDISTDLLNSGDDLSKMSHIDDIFNISNTVDVDKSNIIYEPSVSETPSNDPFGAW